MPTTRRHECCVSYHSYLIYVAASLISCLTTRGLAFSPHSSSHRPTQPLWTVRNDNMRNNEKTNDLWNTLLDRFHGDFDNYQQVYQDRQEGMLPKEGGGHEHIHCTLIPVAENARLAAFYFDGMPQAIFRFRYYHLQPVYDDDDDDSDDDNQVAVDTTLYTLHPQLEAQLRSKSTEPLLWPGLFRSFTEINQNESATVLLPNCEVRWSFQMDPIQHAYAASYTLSKEKEAGIHAIMVQGQAIVDSQMAPGTKILIQDQLSLWSDEFWIHDRGYDPNDLNKFIYGNQRGVPYRLDRVTRITNNQRVVISEDLQWTLGPAFRTDAVYKEKLDAVGGPSAKR